MLNPNPNLHLHVIHRITAGTRVANPLPHPPENRKLRRVWTLINREKLNEVGPIHNVSAFLEDQIHDYRVVAGNLHYYSRVAETGKPVDVVLDFETDAEREARLNVRRVAESAPTAPSPKKVPRS